MSAGTAERRDGDPIYLYAIVRSAPDGRDARAGVDASADRVRTIGSGRYCAVVGDGHRADLKGRSRDDLGRLLIRHQRVIEQLMRGAWVLPVKFGTQMLDEGDILEVLERGCSLFDSAFAELSDCTQLEVLVTWDIGAVFADIANEVSVGRLKAQIANSAEGAAAALRLALGRLVKQALEHRRAAVATHVAEALRAVAIDTIANPVMSDRVVLHLVLLLRTDALGAADRCLETLDAAYGGRLCFRCVGPMPPASFATVEIEFLPGDEIERASRILEVARTASVDEVRSAYHRLARVTHPDTAGRSGHDGITMAALTDGYKALARYARAREIDRHHGGACVSDPDIAARAVLVSIRRPDGESRTARPAAES